MATPLSLMGNVWKKDTVFVLLRVCYSQSPRVRTSSRRLRHARQQSGSLGHRWLAQGLSLHRPNIDDHRSRRQGWRDVAARVCLSVALFYCRRSASRPTPRRRRRQTLTVKCLTLSDVACHLVWRLCESSVSTGSVGMLTRSMVVSKVSVMYGKMKTTVIC